MQEEKEAWVWLNMRPGLNASRLRKAVASFGSAADFLDACTGSLLPDNQDRRLTRLLGSAVRWREEAQREMDRAAGACATILMWDEPGYPEPLRSLEDPPAVLYVLGSYRPEDSASIALVGSRRPSSYGRMVARSFAQDLARAGVVTVSGMAEGIDTCIHEVTIESGGRTLAVLGSGLGRFYPASNQALARRVKDSGAVISEFAMETPPHPSNFPRRNRIISGLSLATVVVEAAARSGTLITARLAAEQGRDVFAVPGPVNSPLCEGTHRLLRDGARIATSAKDIIEGVEEIKDRVQLIPTQETERSVSLSELEKEILSHVGGEPTPVDLIAQGLKRRPQELAVSMLNLEMKGLVQAAPGNAYVRITSHR